jgi:hypothetical protein
MAVFLNNLQCDICEVHLYEPLAVRFNTKARASDPITEGQAAGWHVLIENDGKPATVICGKCTDIAKVVHFFTQEPPYPVGCYYDRSGYRPLECIAGRCPCKRT